MAAAVCPNDQELTSTQSAERDGTTGRSGTGSGADGVSSGVGDAPADETVLARTKTETVPVRTAGSDEPTALRPVQQRDEAARGPSEEETQDPSLGGHGWVAAAERPADEVVIPTQEVDLKPRPSGDETGRAHGATPLQEDDRGPVGLTLSPNPDPNLEPPSGGDRRATPEQRDGRGHEGQDPNPILEPWFVEDSAEWKVVVSEFRLRPREVGVPMALGEQQQSIIGRIGVARASTSEAGGADDGVDEATAAASQRDDELLGERRQDGDEAGGDLRTPSLPQTPHLLSYIRGEDPDRVKEAWKRCRAQAEEQQ